MNGFLRVIGGACRRGQLGEVVRVGARGGDTEKEGEVGHNPEYSALSSGRIGVSLRLGMQDGWVGGGHPDFVLDRLAVRDPWPHE